MNPDLPTYSVSTWDPGDGPEDPWGWTTRHTGLTRWQLRAAIRDVRNLGYEDQVSILVERESSTSKENDHATDTPSPTTRPAL